MAVRKDVLDKLYEDIGRDRIEPAEKGQKRVASGNNATKRVDQIYDSLGFERISPAKSKAQNPYSTTKKTSSNTITSGSAKKPAASASRYNTSNALGALKKAADNYKPRTAGDTERRILNDQLKQNKSKNTSQILSEHRGLSLPESANRALKAINKASRNRVQVQPTVGQEAARQTRGESISDILERVADKADSAIFGEDSGRRTEGTSPTYKNDPDADHVIEETRRRQTTPGSDYDPTDMINSMGLDKDQQNEFWYRYAKDGRRAAVDYVNDIASEWAAEDRTRDEEAAERFAEEHPVLGSARAIVSPIVSAPLAAAGSTIAAVTGSEIDPNHPMFRGDVISEASSRRDISS